MIIISRSNLGYVGGDTQVKIEKIEITYRNRLDGSTKTVLQHINRKIKKIVKERARIARPIIKI